ncbi:hypothetical protein [Psychromonas sp.]|uniref:hypothetical protein n=1 Tax=Psychromonas sp. TaxID=1884585 RepID=UPI003565034C
MKHSKISDFELTERLDAEFYRPEFIDNQKHLVELGCTVPLSNALKNIQLGYTGPTEIYYDPEGVYYLSSKNIVNGNIEIGANTDKIGFEFHNGKLSKTKVFSGDVLISRTGSVGKCALIGGNDKEFNIAAHLIALRINNNFDSAYISCFFNTKFGKNQSIRLQRGTIIQGLSIFDVPNILIPNYSKQAQIYIGNKVRQAEFLREWAKDKDEEIQTYHQTFIPVQTKLDFAKKTRLVSTQQMTERMDAHFYPGVVDTYLNQDLDSFGNLSSCCISIFNGQTQPEGENNCCEQVTVANLSPDYIKGQPREVEAPSKNEKFTKKYDLLMCNAAHNKSYIGKDITFVHSDKPLLPSTEVMVIRTDPSKIPASYLRTYLLSKLGYVQIQSTIRGITAHSYPVDMAKLDIYIPKLTGKELISWLATDELLAKAGVASECSSRLTVTTKLIMEALIEGLLSEDEIITAQQALENGDDTKDKAILRKLTDKGYAAKDGKPLFSDLDTLYELLDEAELDQKEKEQN